ncbi:MAG: protein kinase [Acidobacteriia bacterium]|nr:protein kinase [Terriglobia bacterium]
MDIKDPNNDNLPTLSVGLNSQAKIDLATSGTEPEAGHLFGHYRILRLLGQGGFGQVWDAEDTNTGRRLALKVLTKVQGVSIEVLERFKREGQVAATINHPNCVYIFGAEEIDGYPIITMELMPGGTLQDQLKSKGRLPVTEAVDQILEIIDGLEAAHKVGVLHRDMKPSNCFLDEAGRAKVGDFGLSRTLECDSKLTITGSFLGTPSYASPEQVRGRDLDVRTDIYSVGATLYALLTGKPPFEAEQAGEVLARIVSEPPTPFSQHNARIPAGLERIVLRALAKDRDKRYPSYAALRAQLLPYCSSATTPVTLARRFGAFLLDYLAFYPLNLIMAPLLLRALSEGGLMSGFMFISLFTTMAWFFYFFIGEKFWGRSLGKWVLGLRVVSAEGGKLSYGQAAVRSAVFLTFYLLIPSVVALIQWKSGLTTVSASRWSASVPLCSYAALWILARKRNGYAGLHELASRTRVRSMRHRAELAAPELPLAESSLPADLPVTFGPYRSKALVWRANGRALVAAHDDVLSRAAWIHCYRDAGDAPTMKELADARPGKLHWLNGSRSADWKWDAFEKPSGCGISSWVRTRGSLSWHEIRQVLLGISSEMDAALRDAREQRSLSLEHFWATGYGQVKVLEFPASSGETSQAVEIHGDGWRRLLHQITLVGLENRFVPTAALDAIVPRVPLPEHAQPIIESVCGGLNPAQSPAALAASLGNSMVHSAQLTAGRRLGPGLVTAILPLIMAISLLAASFITSRTPDWMRDLMAVSEYATKLQQLDQSPGNPKASEQGDALRTILAASYLKLKAYPQNEIYLKSLNEKLRPVLESAAKQHPHVSEADLDRARAIVGEAGVGEFLRMLPRLQKALPFGVSVVLGCLAIPAFLLSVILRGGLLIRLFGMSVKMEDGRKAPRYRCALRALITWGMFMLCLPFPPFSYLNHPLSLSTSPWVASLPLAIGITGLIYAAVRPARSIPDLIAGTALVPK